MFSHARLFSFQFFTVKKPRFRNATKKTQGFAHIGVLNNSTIFPPGERGEDFTREQFNGEFFNLSNSPLIIQPFKIQ